MPDPTAPMRSAVTERAPMQRPPKAAAVGIYLELRRKDYDILIARQMASQQERIKI